MDFTTTLKKLSLIESKTRDKKFANEPNEREFETEDLLVTGDDLHRPKRSRRPVAGGDNPMAAFESKLAAIKRKLLGE